MITDQLKNEWNEVVELVSARFGEGEQLDLDAIIFLIGVQELGMGYKKLKKDDKLNVMHIAICRLLEPYGYYHFEGKDRDGWPQYTKLENLPFLKAGEQGILMKEAIVRYFKEENG
jgi:hypothetical protein